jgi:DNA-directed RNA polymerase subunit RPC12/RpoP
MATLTTTKYQCDACGRTVERRDLRRFRLVELMMDNQEVATAKTELCSDCEKELQNAALGFFPVEQAERLHGVVRP